MAGIVSQKVKYICVLLFPLSTEPFLVNLISDSGFSTKMSR